MDVTRTRVSKGSVSHQVILDFLAGRNQKVPDGGDKTGQIRLEFLVVFLRVQRSVVTYLRLEQLQQTRFFFVLTRHGHRNESHCERGRSSKMEKKCEDLHRSARVCYPASAGRGNWSSRFPCCPQKTPAGPFKDVFHITEDVSAHLGSRSACYYKTRRCKTAFTWKLRL